MFPIVTWEHHFFCSAVIPGSLIEAEYMYVYIHTYSPARETPSCFSKDAFLPYSVSLLNGSSRYKSQIRRSQGIISAE